MKINTITENCNYKSHYEINDLADAKIEIKIELETIVSIQSRNSILVELKRQIQEELSKFKWLICGPVYIDFVWYLNDIERQETSKIGDLDNISKPILDSLTGPNGIIIDDSQMMAFYTSWCSRNNLTTPNLLQVIIKFNNDYTVTKENLFFYQVDKAIFTPLNLNPHSKKDQMALKLFLDYKISTRKLGESGLYNRYLVKDIWNFHRTRLNGFKEFIVNSEELENIFKI